jgi:hypothetical protein
MVARRWAFTREQLVVAVRAGRVVGWRREARTLGQVAAAR